MSDNLRRYRAISRTLKVRGGIIAQANRYLGGFCSSQRLFPSQTIQVLLVVSRQASAAAPRGVAPIRHPTASRDTPVAAYGRSNDPIASNSS